MSSHENAAITEQLVLIINERIEDGDFEFGKEYELEELSGPEVWGLIETENHSAIGRRFSTKVNQGKLRLKATKETTAQNHKLYVLT